MKRLIPFALLACLVSVFADEKEEKTKKSHTVEPGTIQVSAEASGPLLAAQKIEIHLEPEKYDGEFVVNDVVPSGTRVKKGEVLVRCDRKRYDEALKAAKEALDDAEKEFALARVEAEIAEKKRALAYESAQLTHDEAQHELEAWTKHRAHAMVREEELSTLMTQYGLDDESQELAQLEEMYKKSELATETKEIVLERARRNIKITQERLGMQKKEEELVKTYDFPDRDRRVKMKAQHAAKEFEIEKTSLATEAEQRRHAMEKLERGLRKQKEEYEKLVRDGALFEIVAPGDGIVFHEMERKGTVDKRKPCVEIWTPDKYELKLEAAEADVTLVSVGARADVFVTAAPMAQLKGMVTEVSLIGKGDGGAKYPFKVTVDGASPDVRFGMQAKVTIWGQEQKDVLWVPRAAVTTKEGKSTVKVKVGETEEARNVVLGPGNADQVIVLKGLAKGDVVVWEVD